MIPTLCHVVGFGVKNYFRFLRGLETGAAIIGSIAERDEVTTRDIAALHPEAGSDMAKVMKNLRDAIEKAGFKDGEILAWSVTGWGVEKRSAYRAGPKLLSSLLGRPAPQAESRA